MPAAKPGEVWRVDLGMAAKVRPCLVLTPSSRTTSLAFTRLLLTQAARGNRWELPIPKPFLDPDGVFDVQRIATVAGVKLERRVGVLTEAEMNRVLDLLAERLGI